MTMRSKHTVVSSAKWANSVARTTQQKNPQAGNLESKTRLGGNERRWDDSINMDFKEMRR